MKYKGKLSNPSGASIPNIQHPTYGMSSKDYDRRDTYENWSQVYNNQPDEDNKGMDAYNVWKRKYNQ